MSIKPFKTYAEQASLLISRGLGSEEIRDEMEQRLKTVGYYRLSAYSYPFRITEEKDGRPRKLNQFRPGTTFGRVWEYYLFDRRLRLLIIDAIERVEVALRVQIAYEWSLMAKIPNPQSMLNFFATKCRELPHEGRLRKFREECTLFSMDSMPFIEKGLKECLAYYASASEDLLLTLGKTMVKIQEAYDRSDEDFARHHKEDLEVARVEELPVWVFIQFSTFGNLHKLFVKGLPKSLKKRIAQNFGVQDVAFFSKALALLLAARNASAHHARMWNKKWVYETTDSRNPGVKCFVPICGATTDPSWSTPLSQFSRSRTAYLLSLLCLLLEKTASTSGWKERVKHLLTTHAPVPSIVQEMGFPATWRQHPLWN